MMPPQSWQLIRLGRSTIVSVDIISPSDDCHGYTAWVLSMLGRYRRRMWGGRREGRERGGGIGG